MTRTVADALIKSGGALLLAALVTLLGPVSVSAHAVLIRMMPSSTATLPRPPDEVQLLFSEPIDGAFSNARVLSADGQAVDATDSHVDPNNDHLLVVSLKPGLQDGVYT